MQRDPVLESRRRARGAREHQASALEMRLRTSSGRRRGRVPVISIVSGKGGVGKTAVAVNLGVALARRGLPITLIDADAGLANADLLLGCRPEFDLDPWQRGEISYAQARCIGPEGLELLVCGSEGETHRTLCDALRSEGSDELGVALRDRDLILVDLAAGLGIRLVELALTSSLVWLVATPEPASLADAYATAKRLWQADPSLRIELLVNRARDQADAERTHQSLSRLIRRFLGREIALRAILPEDGAMLRAVAQQRAVVSGEPLSPVARGLSALAESLVEEMGTLHSRLPAGCAASLPG